MKTLYQLFVLFLLSSQLSAQSFKVSKYFNIEDTTQIHVLETYRGDIFKGRVLTMSEDSLRFLTIGLMELDFKMYEVKNVFVNGLGKIKVKSDKLKYEKTPPLTVIVSSTAFMLPRGVRLYQNVDLFWNSFDIGLGKGFTVGIVAFIPIFFNVKGKYGYKIDENFHIGADVNFINITYDWDEIYPYVYINGIITIGKPNFFINVSVGNFNSFINQVDEFNETVVGFAIGGNIGKKIIYKGEVLIYRGIQFSDKDEVVISPSFSLGWKSENNRNKFDTGIMTVPVGRIWFPYLSYQRLF